MVMVFRHQHRSHNLHTLQHCLHYQQDHLHPFRNFLILHQTGGKSLRAFALWSIPAQFRRQDVEPVDQHAGAKSGLELGYRVTGSVHL